MVSTFLNLYKRFRQFLVWIWEQEGTPAQRARGMALGVFSGCFPLFGLQTFVGVILASLFRGNRLLAVVGTWISNPFTYVPLYWLNYKIGCSILGNQKTLSNFRNLTWHELWDQGWVFSSRVLVGSTFVGVIFALTTGLTLYVGLKYFRKNKF